MDFLIDHLAASFALARATGLDGYFLGIAFLAMLWWSYPRE